MTLLPGDGGRLECSHGNSVSPFRGTGGVAGGDAGLHAVGALQAQRVVRLAAARRRLVMQDGVMDGGRQICGGAVTASQTYSTLC